VLIPKKVKIQILCCTWDTSWGWRNSWLSRI